MKKSALAMMVLGSGLTFANYVVLTDQDYEIVSLTKEIKYTNWQNIGVEFDCSNATPLEDSIYQGTTFTQSYTCNQSQTREKETYIISSNGEKRLKSTETESQIIKNSYESIKTGSFLASSCKEILDSNGSTGDKNYTIYPDGTALTVYCDQTTDGGGWTLVGRSRPVINSRASTCDSAAASYGNFGWSYGMGSLSDENAGYSLNVLNKNINFDQVLFGEYTTGKTWGKWVYKHNLSRTKLLQLNTGTQVIGSPIAIKGGNTGFGMASQIGAIDKHHFFLRDSSAYATFGIMEDGWYSCYGNGETSNHTTPASFGGNVNYKPGMIFVR